MSENKENKEIIGIKFQDKENPKSFSGREYTYYTTEKVEVGDIVFAPTRFGISVGLVTRIGIEEKEIEKIKPFMKTIETKIEDKEAYLDGIKD